MNSYFEGTNFDITVDNILNTDKDEVSIPPHEVPAIASTILTNSGVEFDDTNLGRLDGLDWKGLLSVALACLHTVSLMDYASLVEDSHKDDTELEKLAIKMYTRVNPNMSEPEVRELFSKDSEFRSRAIKDTQDIAELVHESDYNKKYALENELDDSMCSYEQRWDLDRSCVWVSSTDPTVEFFYKNNMWYRSVAPHTIYIPVPTDLNDFPEEEFPLMKESNEQ